MKRIFRAVLLVASAWFFSGILPAHAAPETYKFDPTHTSVLWHVNHMGFSNISGKWMAEGTLELDEATPKNSKVNVTIRMADLLTGVPKLDEHLKNKDFFDVEKFPTATFVSNKVEVLGKRAKVYGTLTMHGISKPVVLKVKFNKMDINPINKKKGVGFSATTEIKRSAFGVGKYTPGVSDDVKIEIEAEAYL
jgi:polyisoprenoid-binding protein YceI